MTGRLRGRRLLTVAEFADLADVSRQQVRAMLRDGRLGGRDLNAASRDGPTRAGASSRPRPTATYGNAEGGE